MLALLVVLAPVLGPSGVVQAKARLDAAPAAVTLPGAGAPVQPAPILGSTMTGTRAVAALGIDAIAAKNGRSSRAELTKFLADPEARVDRIGALYFADQGLGAGIESAAASSGSASAAAAPALAAGVAASDAFLLESRPGASRTMYLDFNGEVVTGSGWNINSNLPAINATPFDRDGDITSFSDAERAMIIDIWAIVSEDYAPFNINVTTKDPGAAAIDRTDVSDLVYGTRVVYTNSSFAQSATGCVGSCTGIAYLNAFDTYATSTTYAHSLLQPAWAFTGIAASAEFPTVFLGLIASHEAGHNLGLSHDSCSSGCANGYYSGQGSWTPIMGSGSKPIQQFSNGDYTGATNTEDDYAVMATHGAVAMVDDYPDSAVGAPIVDLAVASANGLISTRADVDYMKVSSAGGSTTFTASPSATNPDLDLKLELRDSVGTLVASNDPTCGTYAPSGQSDGVSAVGLGATVTATLAAGTYSLAVWGVGCGDATTGYSDYGSRGRYTVKLGDPTLDVSVSGNGSVTSDVGGISCGQTCSADITAGSAVLLTAAPGSGQRLDRWSGPCDRAGGQFWDWYFLQTYNPTCLVTMDQARSVTAVFGASTQLAVSSIGGIVQSRGSFVNGPPPIQCGVQDSAVYPACTTPFALNSSAPISALINNASVGNVFKGWYGPCRVYSYWNCSVSMSAAQTLTAMFATPTSKVLSVSTTGTGTVTSNIGGVNCGATCQVAYEPASTVVLTATPGNGQSFMGWSGDCSGISTCTVPMGGNHLVGAAFGTATSKLLSVAFSGTGTGTITSSTGGIQCVANPAPVITSFTPTSGAAGTAVTITGTGIAAATSVGFNGIVAAYSVASVNSITAVVPTGATTGSISVATAGGEALSAGSFTISGITSGTTRQPISRLTPRCQGTFEPATQVTLTATPNLADGSGFAGWSGGTCSGTASTCTVAMAVATTVSATFAAAPTVASFTPASAAAGAAVTITGTNFANATAVSFNGVAAAFTVVSDTTISAVVPVGATSGKILVTNPGASRQTPTSFTVTASVAAPTVTALSPVSGPVAGGTVVTITGSGFVSGATTVKFGANAGTSVTFVSATSITAVAPAGVAGAVTVTATTTTGGTSTNATQFTYVAAPTVTSLSPTSGPASGGTVVTITGTNLTGATGVKFGANAATNVVVVSATSVTATAPAGVAGAVTVTVTTPGGTSTNVVSFTYLVAPTVTALSPTSGTAAGGTVVTITGTGFVSGATTVKFGANAATNVTFVSATSITATAPAGTAGAAQVTATTTNGTSTNAVSFTYVAAPTVTLLSPTSGPVAGGTVVTITGTGFVSGGTTVKFGAATSATVTFVSATSVTAVAPVALIAGAVTVTAATTGGTSSNIVQFTYVPAPTVTLLSPTSGPVAGGTLVTITG
ncbi:MAG: hypothetical protein F2789_13520, partial [Actinobacteria bacterium]|nr:hypothetical protein [Actinomycetota bacterium]